MEINGKKLQHIYEKWSTKELLKAVTVDKDNYGPVAIDIMNKELKKRDVDNGNKEEFQETYLQEKKASMNSGKLFCPKCYCLNIKKQKPFWAFFLLSPLIYLLIPKYQCLECGYQFRFVQRRLFMQFDKRRAESIFFIGDGPRISKHVIEEGDEATLYYKGNLGMATITSMKGNQMVGTITRSPYDPHLHSELTIGKEIRFLEENIFGISKMTNKA